MIYLDYSATTKPSEEVLSSFYKASISYFANPNSLHKLGTEANELIKASTLQIANLLNIKTSEIIYTSGASESNNTAIKGIAYKYKNRGKHIITTKFEHSSIYGPLEFLEKYEGFTIDYVDTDEYGIVKIDSLEKMIRDDTILVTICSVNSEIGIRQPIEEIGKIVKKHSKCFFHVDLTQSMGKESIKLDDIDLASFSAHKFYGIKGIGCLIKKENIELEPLINGGKSTTKFRSGTPQLPLIVSLSKALRLSLENIDSNRKKVEELNSYLKEELSKIEKVIINSNSNCIPHIINISVLGWKPETLQHTLEENDIYISTQTACAEDNSKSQAVLALTNDESRAKSSVRISISHLTTKEELDAFVSSLKIALKNYDFLS